MKVLCLGSSEGAQFVSADSCAQARSSTWPAPQGPWRGCSPRVAAWEQLEDQAAELTGQADVVEGAERRFSRLG